VAYFKALQQCSGNRLELTGTTKKPSITVA